VQRQQRQPLLAHDWRDGYRCGEYEPDACHQSGGMRMEHVVGGLWGDPSYLKCCRNAGREPATQEGEDMIAEGMPGSNVGFCERRIKA
jgi:hypothetical protein